MTITTDSSGEVDGGSDLLDTENVTGEYPFTLSQLYCWRNRHTGPKSVRIGRRVYYRRRDIEDWIDRLAASQGQV